MIHASRSLMSLVFIIIFVHEHDKIPRNARFRSRYMLCSKIKLYVCDPLHIKMLTEAENSTSLSVVAACFIAHGIGTTNCVTHRVVESDCVALSIAEDNGGALRFWVSLGAALSVLLKLYYCDPIQRATLCTNVTPGTVWSIFYALGSYYFCKSQRGLKPTVWLDPRIRKLNLDFWGCSQYSLKLR